MSNEKPRLDAAAAAATELRRYFALGVVFIVVVRHPRLFRASFLELKSIMSRVWAAHSDHSPPDHCVALLCLTLTLRCVFHYFEQYFTNNIFVGKSEGYRHGTTTDTLSFVVCVLR